VPGFAPILFATDFSPDAALALRHAKEAARGFDAEVIVLHVDETAGAAPMSPDASQRREEARRELERLRAELAEDQISATTLLRPGDAAREILNVAEARAVGMIVLATHGSTKSNNLLLGSVADRVLRHSCRPVLTVRHPARCGSAGRIGRSGPVSQEESSARGAGQRHPEGRLLSRATFDPDGAAHELHGELAERQSETGVAHRLARR
jgi:nucleotide-binding universal stress UspA family protein